MATVAQLRVLLSADTNQFSAGLKKGEASLKSFQGNATAIQKQIAGVVSGHTAQSSQEYNAMSARMRQMEQQSNSIRPVNRTGVEQEVRNEMATRIKAMRAEAMRSRVGEEVNRRMFGDVAAAASTGFANGQAHGAGVLAGIKGSIKSIKSVMQLGGVALITNAASNAANAMADAMRRLDDGTTSVEEFHGELLASIPIVGNLGAAFRNVWNEVDGSASALRRVNAEIAATDMVTGAMKARFDLIQKSAEDTAKAIAGWNFDKQMLGASEFEKKLLEWQKQAKDRQEQINQSSGNALKSDEFKQIQESRKQALDESRAADSKLAKALAARDNKQSRLGDDQGFSEYGYAYLDRLEKDAASKKARLATIEKQEADARKAIQDNANKQRTSAEQLTWAQLGNIAATEGQSWIDKAKGIGQSLVGISQSAGFMQQQAATKNAKTINEIMAGLDMDIKTMDDRFAPIEARLRDAKATEEQIAEARAKWEKVNAEKPKEKRSFGPETATDAVEKRFVSGVVRMQGSETDKAMLNESRKQTSALQKIQKQGGATIVAGEII